MKALSKPISSPGRAEKFPPPLMRFLRSNVGSRSRGRSRSSPMFYLRSKKSAAGVIETTQEPTSPKVTCIGQVRVRRAAKSKSNSGKTSSAAATLRRRRRCWCLKKTLFCGKFSSKKRPFWRIFGKWGLCFRFGYCKKVDTSEDSFRVYSNQKKENIGNLAGGNNTNTSSILSESEIYRNKYENLGAGVQETKRDFLDTSSSSPPKNALLLTRCRSAPYRSSSLAGRFWGSPLRGGDNESENEAKSEELQNPSCENLVEEATISEESSKESENPGNSVQELKGIAGGAMHPLLLTRCKSEPARTGERLIPEASFWNQRRLGTVESFSHHKS